MKSEVVALEAAAWPVLLLDSAGVVANANAAAVRFFGSVLEGETPALSALWRAESRITAEQFLAVADKTPVSPPGLKFAKADGSIVPLVAVVCPLVAESQKQLLVQLLPDSADRAAGAEAGLAHKQKLDCALQLARTVSLDFNNALTSILGHTSLILSKMEPTHPWRASLLEVEKSAAKAAEIANDLGTFSRQEKDARPQAAGNLNLLLQRAAEFLQQNSGQASVEWKLQLEKKLYTAKFDEAKMQQAFIKILENSLQALPGQGRISVQTRNIDLSEATQDRNVRLAAGSYVCVEIGDNGCGIEADVLPRIFEPFFTTKRSGTHRGLGLAWVYGIVTNHGGGVAVSSQPGTGTSVRVYLPAEKRIVKETSLNSADLSGGQTLLIVDDEDLLLTMGQTILSSFGYRVLTANTGQKALDILAKNDPLVDLVITDLVMPAMSGRELVEQIRKLSPEMRVICTSGYVWPASQFEDGAYLQKPFTSQELLQKVKHALSS
jgi:signal transduction histidine kinase